MTPLVILAVIILIILTSKRKRRVRRAVPAVWIFFAVIATLALLAEAPVIGLGLLALCVTLAVTRAPRERGPRVYQVPPTIPPELEASVRSFQADLRSFLGDVEQLTRPREPLPVHASVASKFAPARQVEAKPASEASLPSDELAAGIERLVRQHDRVLPAEAKVRMRAVAQRVQDVMTYLRERDAAQSEHAFIVRKIATDYLPGAVNAYLRLPRGAADTAPLQGEKTGKDLLTEQLALLEQAVQDVLTDVTRAASQELLAHGRFLEEKFDTRRKDFEL